MFTRRVDITRHYHSDVNRSETFVLNFKLHTCYYLKENMFETVGGAIIQVHMNSMKNEKEAYYSMSKITAVNVYQIRVIVK